MDCHLGRFRFVTSETEERHAGLETVLAIFHIPVENPAQSSSPAELTLIEDAGTPVKDFASWLMAEHGHQRSAAMKMIDQAEQMGHPFKTADVLLFRALPYHGPIRQPSSGASRAEESR